MFSGTARDAAAGFPANVNVVAALALAGIGPDRTMIDIWADPAVTRNCHVIEVDADSARFTLQTAGDNPKTAASSRRVIATLRKLGRRSREGVSRLPATCGAHAEREISTSCIPGFIPMRLARVATPAAHPGPSTSPGSSGVKADT